MTCYGKLLKKWTTNKAHANKKATEKVQLCNPELNPNLGIVHYQEYFLNNNDAKAISFQIFRFSCLKVSCLKVSCLKVSCLKATAIDICNIAFIAVCFS